MSCCGNRRAAMKSASARSNWFAAPPPPTEPVRELRRLRYRGPAPMLLAGEVSTRIYELYEADAWVEVDACDEAGLRQTGWFEAAG